MDHVRQGLVLTLCVLLLAGLAAADIVSEDQKSSTDQLNAMSAEQFKTLIKRAEHGDPPAQALLGIAYLTGVKVSRDDTSALEWFHRAAKKGNYVAENNLGLLYFYGRGAKQNYFEAAKWFRKAGDDGSNNARFNLALMYHHGYGVAKDIDQAAKWYEVAAIEGDALAQNTIAFLYEHGNGVVQDLVQAEKWYRKAAEQGQVMAQYNLGAFYLGQKRHQDAYEWFLRAAKQGHAPAAHNLAILNLHGHCMPINYGEAYRWLTASHQVDDWSVKALAVCKEHLSDKDMEQLQAVAKAGGTP